MKSSNSSGTNHSREFLDIIHALWGSLNHESSMQEIRRCSKPCTFSVEECHDSSTNHFIVHNNNLKVIINIFKAKNLHSIRNEEKVHDPAVWHCGDFHSMNRKLEIRKNLSDIYSKSTVQSTFYSNCQIIK